ncbi:MAG: penicillin acylase family protein, partial [Candidatus Latescibacterota bacterium]
VTGTDMLAHLQRVVHMSFVARGFFQQVQHWGSPGSNAWAIAPSHAAAGNAMLLTNPHLPWAELFLLFEAQLKTPEFDAYGAAFIGLPLPAFAFNDHLGWTHTVTPADGSDLYELTLTKTGYRVDDEDRVFEEEIDVLRVKKEDGSMRKDRLIIRKSVYGPIVSMQEGKALAIRIVGFDRPHLFEQYYDMMRARNLSEFETALRQMQQPTFNVIYADKDGHIMYLYGGLIPRRQQGDWNYWQGIIPGNRLQTLWTETLSYDELPRYVDPPSGWIQNTNDPPWYSTFPNILSPQDYPSNISSNGMSLRSQRSVRMITEDESISFEELIQYQHSTRLELADRILDDVIAAARKYGNNLAREAADLLEDWDRCVNADSRGAVLFGAWVPRVRAEMFAIPWNDKDPLATPSGLADPAAAVAALEEAALSVINDFDSLNVAWGDIHKLRYGPQNYPANGGPDILGGFRTLFFIQDNDPQDPSTRFRPTHGDSYVSVVEFSDPVRAKALLSYGNASQPGSKHKGDQLELYARKELRPVWRTREEIEANLQKKKTF